MTLEPIRWYIVESRSIQRIEQVMTRLFSENRLTGDEMRNLAKELDIVLANIIEFPNQLLNKEPGDK